jgi:hypothetical protein
MGKRIDTPANPEVTVSQQIFEDLRAQSRKNKPEFKMPMGPPTIVRKAMPLTPKRVIPQRPAVGGKQSVQTTRRTTALLGSGPIPAGKSSVRNNGHLLKFDKPEDLF